jgi:hypothetical protein
MMPLPFPHSYTDINSEEKSIEKRCLIHLPGLGTSDAHLNSAQGLQYALSGQGLHALVKSLPKLKGDKQP